MRVFISSDIERAAGISDSDQVRIGAPEFAVGDARRVDARTVTITSDDPPALFRTFVTIVALTRSIVE